MKKLIYSIAISAYLLVGCSGNKTNEHDHNDGTHQHEDGSIHHNHENDSAIKQEEFTVPLDSASKKNEEKHDHSHDGKDGLEHPHNH